MTKTMPIVEARRRLTALPDELKHDGESDVVEVTRRGKPVLAVMPWDLYEAIAETLEVMGDERLLAGLRQSIREIGKGEAIPWEEAKRELER